MGINGTGFFYRLDVLRVTQSSVKGTQSMNPDQWPGFILSSSSAGLLTEGGLFLYTGSPMSIPHD